jgi:hypothetical protein
MHFLRRQSTAPSTEIVKKTTKTGTAISRMFPLPPEEEFDPSSKMGDGVPVLLDGGSITPTVSL